MKISNGTTFVIIGLMFTTLGSTVLNEYKILQYSSLILGVILTICSVFLFDKSKKSQNKIKNKDSSK